MVFSKKAMKMTVMRFCLSLLILVLYNAFAPHLAWGQQEVSVDKFTGTANVSIPLASLEIKDLPFSLTLNYAASGIQTNDEGGPVGMGWSLGGIPSISREVRGMPDDFSLVETSISGVIIKRHGWMTPTGRSNVQSLDSSWPSFSYPLNISATCGSVEEQRASSIVSAFEPTNTTAPGATMYDSEPDVFSYSVPGHVGRFVYDKNGHARTMPFDPITITYSVASADSLSAGCISSFTIATPEGNTYTFSVPDIMHRKSAQFNNLGHGYVVAEPTIFQREFYYYLLPSVSMAYATKWHISVMENATRETINFSYAKRLFFDSSTGYEPSIVNVAASVSAPKSPEYNFAVRRNTRTLSAITSPTAFIRFVADTSDYIYDKAPPIAELATGLRTSRGNVTVKTLHFDSDKVAAFNDPHYNVWTAKNGFELTMLRPRRFLRELRVTTSCGSPLSYKFKYRAVEPFAKHASIPPPGGVYTDYWGHLRFDAWGGWFAGGDGPFVFEYPTLIPQNVPGGRFRLFPMPNTVVGVDVQTPSDNEVNTTYANLPEPAGETNFQRSTLRGTLEAIRLPTGGRITLEYEPQWFHDPVVESLHPNSPDYAGPGVRVRVVTYTDDVNNVSQRREYQYNELNDKSSGRLLWHPAMAFQRPFSSDVVYVTDNLADHTFESRNLGYGRVTEIVAGRGKTVTTFAVDADANAIAANPANGQTGSAPGSDLPLWNRTTIGPARSSAACVSFPNTVSPVYTAGFETYPFPPSTNYDFWRGQPLSVVRFAEPVGTAAPVAVSRTSYLYSFRNLNPTAAPVVGWAYDGVTKKANGTSVRAFVVARYQLLTDFQLAVRQETNTLYDQGTATVGNTTSTRFAYNGLGRLAMVTRTNDDGSVIRTRYKYSSDYNIPAYSPTLAPSIRTLAYRLHEEKRTSDLIETISEIAPAGTSGARLAGITLNSFVQDGPAQHTRPYQTLQWQRATPPPHAQNPTDTTGFFNQSWQVSNRFRPESTIEQVGAGFRQVPITVSQRKGGTINGLHLGYSATLPTLQVTNAYASEVRFSDFESTDPNDLTYTWQASATGTSQLATAARTGSKGLRMMGLSSLSTQIPAQVTGFQLPPAVTGLRFSCWVMSGSPAQLTIQIGQPATPPVFTKNIPIGNVPNGWQLVEIPIMGLNALGITAANRQSFTVSLVNRFGQTVDVDDVLLLPSTAVARSITYNAMGEKTTETSPQGQTTYYNYTPAGRLQAIRDHQNNLVKRTAQVIGGRNVDESIIGINISPDVPGVNGGMFYHYGQELTFNVSGICEEVVSYEWNFGCPGFLPCTSTSASPTFEFPAGVGVSGYSATVSVVVTTLHGTRSASKLIHISDPPPPLPPALVYTTCASGSVSLDYCGNHAPPLECGNANYAENINPNITELRVYVANASNLNYSWEVRIPDSAHPNQWENFGAAGGHLPFYSQGSTYTNVLRATHMGHSAEYRCVIDYPGPSGSPTTIVYSPSFFIEVRNQNTTCN